MYNQNNLNNENNQNNQNNKINRIYITNDSRSYWGDFWYGNR
jgi:hypothetical protein